MKYGEILPSDSHMRMRTLIGDIFNMHIISCSTSEQISETLKLSVWEPLAAKRPSGRYRCQRWMASYCHGLIDLHYDLIQRHHVEFVYRFADGVAYSTHKDSKHRKTEEFYQAGKGHLLGLMPSGFIWKNWPHEGIKTYYGFESESAQEIAA